MVERRIPHKACSSRSPIEKVLERLRTDRAPKEMIVDDSQRFEKRLGDGTACIRVALLVLSPETT